MAEKADIGDLKAIIMSRWVKIFLVLLAVFLLLQFIPVDRNLPDDMPVDDFLVYANAPDELADKIRTSCYPCHSYNSTSPSLVNSLFPMSYFHEQRLQSAREALNFQEWTRFDVGTQYHKMEATVNVLRKGHEPFNNYVSRHPEAYWDADQYRMLLEYFENWKAALI